MTSDCVQGGASKSSALDRDPTTAAERFSVSPAGCNGGCGHTSGRMAKYTIIAHPGGYDVQIVGMDGIHQSVLGFETEAAANAWIARDRRLAAVEERTEPLASAPEPLE